MSKADGDTWEVTVATTPEGLLYLFQAETTDGAVKLFPEPRDPQRISYFTLNPFMPEQKEQGTQP